MKKISFTFPDHNSLWLFRAKTKAIHIRVEPKKNRISGLFESHEIELAVKHYNAVPSTDKTLETCNI